MAKRRKRRTKTRRRVTKKKQRPTDWLVVILIGVFVLALGLILLVQFYGEQTQQNLAQEAKQAQVDQNQSKKQFIKKIAPYAQTLQTKYHVLASITIAQAILESDWGRSTLASKYHNYFGVKGSDQANTKEMTTKEYVNGQWTTITARFRVYSDYQASMLDHVLLFVNGTDWNAQQYQHVLAASNYQEAAAALKQDGYATDPDYPSKLIEIVKTYNLAQYDQ